MKINIFSCLRMWFALNNIQQKTFSEKYSIPRTTISETLNGTKKDVPENFKEAFFREFGFSVYDVYEHIREAFRIPQTPLGDERKSSNLAATLFLGRSISNGTTKQFREMAEDMEKRMYIYLKEKYEK